MSRGLEHDADHLSDEFNCYISSFPAPLQSAFPSALIRGFGLQPASISWPKSFGKTRRRFQSNDETEVRVIQICEASERYTTRMVNKENKEKQNGGKKGTGSPAGSNPACFWSQEDELLAAAGASFFFFFNVLLSF